MIEYTTGNWGVWFIFSRREGSVFQKAIPWALVSAILTVVINRLVHDSWCRAKLNWSATPASWYTNNNNVAPISLAFGLFLSIFSFLLVFRNQEAYKIWIEAGVLMKTVRSSWFNAYSSLIAFRTRDASRAQDVEVFESFLLRLISLLYCAALQQVLPEEKDTFEIIDLNGIDLEHLEFLQERDNRVEKIHQWLQRLIVQADDEKVLQIAPPILGRVHNDLAAGMVALSKARRITDFYFPFPYAQTLTTFLLLITILQPVMAATFIESPLWASALAFLVVFTMWSINYVGHEIERPFGDSPNDLPLMRLQLEFNRSLEVLLEKEALQPPVFNLDQANNDRVSLKDGMEFAKRVRLPVLRSNTRRESAMQRGHSKVSRGRESVGSAQSVQSGGNATPPRKGPPRRMESIPARRDSWARRDSLPLPAHGKIPSGDSFLRPKLRELPTLLSNDHEAVDEGRVDTPVESGDPRQKVRAPKLVRKIGVSSVRFFCGEQKTDGTSTSDQAGRVDTETSTHSV
jgi:putative membrane protein